MADPLLARPVMRGSVFLPLMLVGGCAGHRGIVTEPVGTGHGVVSTRGATSDVSAAPGGGGMTLPRGTYDFELRIGVPRAQLVDWRIACTGVEKSGQVGQAFEDYKEHRLAQLTKEREQQAKIYARALNQPPPASVVVVARPGARVITPVGRVEVRPAPVVVRGEAQVPPVPEPREVEVEVPPVTELPPGDAGQGVFPARVRVVLAADGVCAITATADDPNVNAFYSVTRERDLGIEAAQRKQLVYVGAVTTRGRVNERLVALGADPLAKQRRLEADARARAEAERKRGEELARQREAELQVNLELKRKADAEAAVRARREGEAAARLEIERIEREAAAEVARRERWAIEQEEAQRAQELEYAAAWEAEAPARARMELLIYQKEVSIRWRLTIIGYLVGHGADPDRRGRIARAAAAREAELQAKLQIKLEIERIERERLIRIRMEEDRKELERKRESERVAREQREQRDRERQARLDAERAERENREAIERDRRERTERERAESDRLKRAQLAALELRRTTEVAHIRQTIVSSLIGFGAKLRPPMPALRIEEPGPAPFDGAVWAAGRWEWSSIRVEWQWRGGGWRDSTRFGQTGGETVAVRRSVEVEPAPLVVIERPVTTVTTTVVAPVTPAVIEVNARPSYEPRPRPTYQPRPRPAYQPRPSQPRPSAGYQPRPQPKPAATRQPTAVKPGASRDDEQRRR